MRGVGGMITDHNESEKSERRMDSLLISLLIREYGPDQFMTLGPSVPVCNSIKSLVTINRILAYNSPLSPLSTMPRLSRLDRVEIQDDQI